VLIFAGVVVLSGEIRYYRGLHKVRIVSQSEGYWIVEAQEDFEDSIGEQKIVVKTGEQRILLPNLLYTEKTLAPPVKEHAYELKMEKKVKRMVEKEEKKQAEPKVCR
jgi:hypothetical protein